MKYWILLAVASVGCAQTHEASNRAVDPYRVAANIYYVGTNQLASFLITTPQGNILINSGYEDTVPVVRRAVEKLGFRFADTKYLLLSQAHDDHAAGSFLVRELTGAKVLVMEGDAEIIEHGGKGDFRYDGETSWKPCKVDRVLHDGDRVTLGGTTLVAHLTPGHTKGCTTWTTTVREGTRSLNVVIVGGTTVNPGYHLVNNPKYPGIANDYARTFRVLRALSCDVFLGAHPSYYQGQTYAEFVDGSEKQFLEKLKAQENARK